MPLTQIKGTQIRAQAINEEHLKLSDVSTNNATSQRHGFLPKLPGGAGYYLNGLGEWVPLSGTQQVLPDNTYYVSPSFTSNSGRYWSDLKLLEVEINNNAGPNPLIIIYPGDYTWNGNLSFGKFVTILAESASLLGSIFITVGANIYANRIGMIEFSGTTNRNFVVASAIDNIKTSGVIEEPTLIIVDNINTAVFSAQHATRCNLVASVIANLDISGSGVKVQDALIQHANLGGGKFDVYNCKVQTSALSIYGGSKARFHNCYFKLDGINVLQSKCAFYDCFIDAVSNALSLTNGEVLLSNTNICCGSSYSVDGTGLLYVRGQSTANRGVASAITNVTPTTLTIDNSFSGEVYFY